MTDYKHIYSRRLKNRDSIKGYAMLALLVASMGFSGWLENQPAPVEVVPAVAKSATQERIERILPATYAQAIAERATYPITMAAIAYTETVSSGHDHRAIGDGGKSKGLFQIQPRFWGSVKLDDLEQQVARADQVFVSLVKQYGYKQAVKRWNGDGPAADRYQRIVLAKVEEMQR